MSLPNINCKHYTREGTCVSPNKGNVFFFFRPHCVALNDPFGKNCMIMEKYEKPDMPPPPPPRPPGPKGPPPRPPEREWGWGGEPNQELHLDNKEVSKRIRCLKNHRGDWNLYSVGRSGEGRVKFAICAMCGCRHIMNNVIHTEEDTIRKMRELGI